jgi:hypothetical protein
VLTPGEIEAAKNAALEEDLKDPEFRRGWDRMTDLSRRANERDEWKAAHDDRAAAHDRMLAELLQHVPDEQVEDMIDAEAAVLRWAAAQSVQAQQRAVAERRAVLEAVIDAVLDQQMTDAARLAGDPSHGHGSWCHRGNGTVCHVAEADAAHNRTLLVLRRLLADTDAQPEVSRG